jgi:stage V sporulation protein SpoVS
VRALVLATADHKQMHTDRDRSRRQHNDNYARDTEHYEPQDLETSEEADRVSRNSIKVSATSNVKQVAGKIAHSVREGEPPAILTIGPSCINQAVKSIAIARGYLDADNWDVSFQPAFRDRDRSKASVALYLAKQRPAEINMTGQVEQLLVKGNSQPSVVAGALAARVREQKTVCLTAIGVDAVTNAVLSVGNARLYLAEDGLDIRTFPEFVHVMKNNLELSAVRFNIVSEQI